jgi:hypothetical protein
VLDENDVAVYFNTTLLTLTTDYTVAVNANGTGSVTIVTGTNVPSTPTASDTIIIVGARDIERVTDFVTAGDLLASSLNEQLDSLTIFDQQVAEENKRSLRAPVYDPALVEDGGTLDMTLPAKAARAGKYLQFNSTTGNPEAGPDSTDVTALADIATDIATLADIEDGTDATDAIQTAASISSNISTVAGISANVTTVAGISSDVTAVAADATDIGTVATNIASVNTVATNISDVIAVANDLNEAVSEVETVANDLNEAVSEIETVAASISNVDAVGTNIANVNTVAGNNANVTTVAGISANVTTVAGISGNVTTVAGISSDVTTVAADGTDIGTVATNIANVNSVAGNATNINSVATNATNINTVAGISSNVTTVAGISSDVTAVAGDATDIGTVSTNIANVNTVAGSITNVNTVATNISGVNSFAERYRVAASDPSTSLDEGDLAYNTTDNSLKYYNGTSWNSITPGIANIVEDATPQLGGTLDLNSQNITGAGNINIAGTVTADGLTVSTSDPYITLTDSDTGVDHEIDGQSGIGNLAINVDKNSEGSNSGLVVNVKGNQYMRVDDGGDISFYDSTGTTQGFFWDASTQRLGLGTTSPSAILTVSGSHATNWAGRFENTSTSGYGVLAITAANIASHRAFEVRKNTSDTAMLIDGAGNVGIGTASVDNKLHLEHAGTLYLQIENTSTANKFYLGNSGGNAILESTGAYSMNFKTNGSEAARFDSSQNFLLGKTASDRTVAGGEILSSGGGRFTRDSATPLYLNRLTNDGDAIDIRRNDTVVGSISVTASGTTYNTTSDIRLKQDIEPLEATDKLMAMNPVSYAWKADPDGPRSMGFIAQEMQELMPEAVSTGDNDDAMMSMDYGRITPILVSALQDAHRKIEQLEQRIADMEAK